MSTSKRERKYPRVQSEVSGEHQTQQHFKHECDINNIVAKYTATGIDPAPPGAYEARRFGYATSKDFAESAFAVAEIKSAFAELPSSERARFQNSPERWIEHYENQPLESDEIVAPEAPEEPQIDPETTPSEEGP